MPSSGTFYGVVVVLVACLLVSSSLAANYYGLYAASAADSQRHVSELNAALAQYQALSTSYHASLESYNTTLHLLAGAVAIVNTSSAAYLDASVALPALWKTYRDLASASGSPALAYAVDVKVDFGNGTQKWFNGTGVQPGWNGYLVTLVVFEGRVDATWYPQFGAHFVSGLGGVSSNESTSWFLWQHREEGWVSSQGGVDSIPVYNGTVIAWTLCGYDPSYSPECTP